MKTAEEILNEHMVPKGIMGNIDGVLKAMEAYASQFKSSETEVHNKAIEDVERECDKWMRDGFSVTAILLSLKNLKK